MNPPKISVVLPTHNRASTLLRAVDSVLRQHDVDRELIVVDDGSTDDTATLLQPYLDQLVYVRLEAKHGSNFARNRGIERATGDVVCFIDSDDEFLPTKLQVVAEFFAGHPHIDALIDSFETVYPPQMRKAPKARRNPVLLDNGALRQAVFTRDIYKATPAISVRRGALLQISGFDETLTRRQDMDLLLRLSRGHACASIDKVLWIKHWSADAISSKHDTFLAATIEIVARHPIYLSDPDYRCGLHRDLGRHFWRLLSGGRLADLRADLRRYREFGQFDTSAWLLVLKYLQHRGQRLIAARRGGKKLSRQYDQVVAPAQHQRSRHLP